MSISGVTLKCIRDGHWRSKGISTNTNTDGSFKSYADAICTLTITNNNSYIVKIDSITLPLGTGTGELWGSGQFFNVTGANCQAAVIDSSRTVVGSGTVTTSVTVNTTGSSTKSGWFNNPSTGTALSCNFTVAANSSITLGIGVNGGSGSTSGPILSCDNGYSDGDNDNSQISRYVDIQGSLCSCSITSAYLSPTSVLSGNSVEAKTSGVTPSDASKSYQWYTKSDSIISGATSATRIPTSDGEYCKITISKSGYNPVSATTGTVTYYTSVSTPSNLTITGSKADGKYTNREDYTFSWNASTSGTNNAVSGYDYWICVDNDTNSIKVENYQATSIKYSISKLVDELNLQKGSILYFYVLARGTAGYHSGWVCSSKVPIVSAAVVRVKVGSSWTEGIAYVNKGTANNPNWVEAEDVYVKNSSGQWKTSV